MRSRDEQIALFDMDGSLADHDGRLIADLRKLQAPGERPVRDLWTAEKLPHIGQRMRLIKSQPGWWFNLRPIANGMRVFNEARRIGFSCHILTKGPRRISIAWKEKVEWCQHHLGDDVPVHVTSAKGLVYGKLLYDDFPPYCLDWLKNRPRGLVIMPVRPYNKDFHHPQVVKWTGRNWRTVVRALELCYERAEREPLVI